MYKDINPTENYQPKSTLDGDFVCGGYSYSISKQSEYILV